MARIIGRIGIVLVILGAVALVAYIAIAVMEHRMVVQAEREAHAIAVQLDKRVEGKSYVRVEFLPRDPWGKPYRANYGSTTVTTLGVEAEMEVLWVSSAGPDGEHGNQDDIRSKMMKADAIGSGVQAFGRRMMEGVMDAFRRDKGGE